MRFLVSALSVLVVACTTARPTAGVPTPHPAGPSAQVTIVGGGIAGLVAAYELERLGISVQMLELTDRLGGRISSVSYGPQFAAEAGMQELWAKSPLTEIARRLGLTFDQDVAYSSVIIDGKLAAYTQDTNDEFFDALFNREERKEQKAWMAQAEILYSELSQGKLTPRLRRLVNLSFEEWLQESVRSPRVAEWLRLTLECELGSRSTQFSALFGLSELRVFLFGGENALHIRGGNERLVRALDAAIRGPKTFGARVTRIRRGQRPDGARWAEATYLKAGHLETVTSERILVAIPWTGLHTLQLDPPLPEKAWHGIESLGRGQYVKVHFIVDEKVGELWGGSDGNPFPVLSRGPLGVIYGPEAAVQGRRRIFTLLLYGEQAERAATLPRDQLRSELIAGLDRLWPGFGNSVEAAHFYAYVPSAIPYWPKGRAPEDEQSQFLFSDFDGMYLAGDWLVSSHGEGATRSALRQASAIARDLKATATAH